MVWHRQIAPGQVPHAGQEILEAALHSLASLSVVRSHLLSLLHIKIQQAWSCMSPHINTGKAVD